MSQDLTDNQVAKFNDQVHQAYDGTGQLKHTVRLAQGIVGATYQFQKMGQATMIQRTPQTPVLPANIAHTNAVATLEDWYVAEYSDKFDQQKVNYQETGELARMFGTTGGRRIDQQIIDAAEAASTTLTIANGIGGNTGMNSGKFRRASFLHNDNNVPGEERVAVISAEGLEQLLGDASADTIDKNTVKILFKGAIQHWLGYDIFNIGQRQEGGLPRTGVDRTSFFWHRTALGLAIGQDPRSMIDWVPQFTSHLVQSHYIGGAIAIDALGIVEVATVEV